MPPGVVVTVETLRMENEGCSKGQSRKESVMNIIYE
jgi:hypothetical protein